MKKITDTISKFLLLTVISSSFVYAEAGNEVASINVKEPEKAEEKVDIIELEMDEKVLMHYINTQKFSLDQRQSILNSLPTDRKQRSIELLKWRDLIVLEAEVAHHTEVFKGIGTELENLPPAIDGASRDKRFAALKKATDKFLPIKAKLQAEDQWHDVHFGSALEYIKVLTPEKIKSMR